MARLNATELGDGLRRAHARLEALRRAHADEPGQCASLEPRLEVAVGPPQALVRFLLPASGVAALLHLEADTADGRALGSPVLTSAFHAPGWMCGLLAHEDELVGVVDLARALGIPAGPQPGVAVVLAPSLMRGMALRVADAGRWIEGEALQAVEPEDAVEADALVAVRSGAGALRPPFWAGRWQWQDQGVVRRADELQLSALVRHPRLAELGA